MLYPAYLLTTTSLPRNHHSIFNQTSPSGSGFIYQVSGNIQTGMFFNHKQSSIPLNEADFLSMTQIGCVSVQDFEDRRLKQVVESVEEPKKQFDGPRRLFSRNNREDVKNGWRKLLRGWPRRVFFWKSRMSSRSCTIEPKMECWGSREDFLSPNFRVPLCLEVLVFGTPGTTCIFHPIHCIRKVSHV